LFGISDAEDSPLYEKNCEGQEQESWQLDRFVPVSGLSIYSMFLLDVLLYDGHICFLMILVLKIGNRTGKSFN